ncbi:hypothetical protein EYF80_013596 [Liparis tanakae]|uniref:Uncharacterized protein n=1 Tax=Liparis tanakae TaxID=230148 RepID=A0A4Z2IEQ2_9TELE|nr:hypothetical protein EYF80_013596 [Liparis tanakae]
MSAMNARWVSPTVTWYTGFQRHPTGGLRRPGGLWTDTTGAGGAVEDGGHNKVYLGSDEEKQHILTFKKATIRQFSVRKMVVAMETALKRSRE